MTSLNAELLAAYQRTEYRVSDRAYAFVLRVEEPSPLLRACHDAYGVRCSTFLTAWNPHSALTPVDVNEAAMAHLEHDLDAMGLRWLRGEGVDPAGGWPGEPSLLALGLDAAAAVILARRFAQNAIVCAADDAVPHLVMCG